MFKPETISHHVTGRFLLGGVPISATQWRRLVRRTIDANIRRAKRTRTHFIMARHASAMFPKVFGATVGTVSLVYRPRP